MESTNQSTSRKSVPNWWNKLIIPLIIAAIIGIITTIINHGQKITKLEAEVAKKESLTGILERIAKLESKIEQSEKSVPIGETPIEPIENPKKKFIEMIKEQQSIYVKESWGTEAYQCFTDEDFNKFISSEITLKIVEDLKQNNEFISLVLATKKLPPNDWQRLKNLGKSTYKRTWGEIGRITREGQTEAGQKAEKLIAKAIVDLVSKLRKQPDSEIIKLYN